MVTDSRGHQVPAGSDSWGYREDMEQLSASITDVRSVADQAAATTAVADLDAADLATEGTVWWLTSPGTLVVYTGGEFVPLPTTPDLEGQVVTSLATNTNTAASPAQDYPVGISTMFVAGSDFPLSDVLVTTIRDPNAAGALQLVNRVYSGLSRTIIRNGTLTEWAPWAGGGPYGQAAGVANASDVPANGGKNVTVTFPSATFTQEPSVVATIITSGPSTWGLGVSSRSKSSAVLRFANDAASKRNSAASWTATQMASTSASLLRQNGANLAAAPETDIVTCPTDGCSNAGIPIPVPAYVVNEGGNQEQIDNVVCGVCGTDITNTQQEA